MDRSKCAYRRCISVSESNVHALVFQESVVTTIVKLSLKSLQEFVRLHTFNRSGFQQIQLDIHFLKTTIKDIAEDEAAVDFLLDEVRKACFRAIVLSSFYSFSVRSVWCFENYSSAFVWETARSSQIILYLFLA